MLAVVRAADPWYDASRTPGQSGHCGAFMNGRPRSFSLVLSGDSGHDVYGNEAVMRRILKFLGDELALSRARGR